MKLPIKGGEYQIPWQFECLLRDTYYDVPEELTKMRVWLEANPSRKPTSRGAKRFIVNWLNRGRKLRPVLSVEPKPENYVKSDKSVISRALQVIKEKLGR